MDPNGRVTLVTGASRGIGAAIGRALAEDGHRVAWAARDVAALEALAKAHGGLPVPMDVTDAASVQAGLDLVAATLGPVEVLVNNAGVAESAPLARVTDESWERTLTVNLTAPFRITRAVVPGMVERGWGRVVFVASNAGLTGYRYTSAYCASKHGIVGLMRALAAELATTGVTVNAVCPGFVDTDMTAAAVARIQKATGRSAEAARGMLEDLNPQKRIIQPDEVVHVVRMLLADGARGIHGQAIAVDGGQVMT
jgi:NAD(P)-dependent dehydrogenase (short-subunit alcohol dehydrogenase family)